MPDSNPSILLPVVKGTRSFSEKNQRNCSLEIKLTDSLVIEAVTVTFEVIG